MYEARRGKYSQHLRGPATAVTSQFFFKNATFPPSSPLLRLPKEPPLTPPPASLRPPSSSLWGCARGGDPLLPACCPIVRELALSFPIYSPINPSCWSLTGTLLSAVSHVAQITVSLTHTRTHAHTQYVAVLHPCLLSEARCGSMMCPPKNQRPWT